MRYDIADILEVRDLSRFLAMMQEEFEETIGSRRFFRITATSHDLGQVSADVDSIDLRQVLENPPNPNGRFSGWVVKPLGGLRRTALGLQNERFDYHHLRFIRNGHLEFWTEVDENFCWRQDAESLKKNPRLYPYAVVEYPVSFVRLYQVLQSFLNLKVRVTFQMQYLNIRGAILLPYQPESISFQHPVDPVIPFDKDRLLFPKKDFPHDYEPDPVALELIKDLYNAFGFGREHIPFFDQTGHCKL